MAHQEHNQKFLQNKGGKNIAFVDENIPYLESGRGDIKSLNEKNWHG